MGNSGLGIANKDRHTSKDRMNTAMKIYYTVVRYDKESDLVVFILKWSMMFHSSSLVPST